MMGGGSLEFPSVITIFSAPNYCGSYQNKGAYFILDRGAVQLRQFNETEQPYRLPMGLNVFTWSAPFIADRIVNMFANLLKQAAGDSTPAIEQQEATPKTRSEVSKVLQSSKDA
jgi:serine/threonine-protein phosphatase 2B catalytic subunit